MQACGDRENVLEICSLAGLRLVAQTPESRARRSTTQQTHVDAIRNWKPSQNFAWLDRKTYINKIQPCLAGVTISALRSALGISEPYAAFIRSGSRVPHPRHWPTLARLVGLALPHAEAAQY
jgi:hypothetical protein